MIPLLRPLYWMNQVILVMNSYQQEVFDSITIDDCLDAECPYLIKTRDAFNTGDSPTHYGCSGNVHICPCITTTNKKGIDKMTDENIYTTTLRGKELRIPYYYSVIGDKYYIAFNENVSSGNTMITLTDEQVDKIRDDIATLLKEREASHDNV